ncbi:MAG: hypothetical protein HKN87_04905 [Saprospiraceae bacterium]|nr:hypothetical protein [Saprospiraceae bacterium]
MSVERIEKSPIESELAISIPKSEYEPKLKSEMRKYQQKAHMKGFRKGKVPMSVIKKMYGKAMLAEVVNEMVQKQLGGYLQEEKLEVLGQPIPSKDQENYDFEDLQDFEFKFDVGVAPHFEVKGIEEDTQYNQYLVKVTDEMIDDELLGLRKKSGKEIEVDSDFEEADRFTFAARELEDEHGDLKKKGFETTFSTLLSSIEDESLQEKIKSIGKGEKIRFNIFTLEGDRSEDYVRKYLLNISEEEEELEVGEWYEAQVQQVNRIAPADLDEAFFEQAFQEKVKTESEARDLIKKNIEAYYQGQTDALMFKDFQDKLLELNKLTLPDEFLQRWLLVTNEELDEAQLETTYQGFSQNLTWTLIERAIQDKFDLKVEREEVRAVLKAQLLQYMGNYGLPENMMDEYVDKMMANQEQVEKAYQEKMTDKVFEAIRDQVTLENQYMDVDDFREKIESVQKQVSAKEKEEEE